MEEESRQNEVLEETLGAVNETIEEVTKQEEAVKEDVSSSDVPSRDVPSRDVSPSSNLIKLREAKEKAEYERDKILEYYRNDQQQKKPEPVEEFNDFNIGEDDLAEGKHLNKVAKRIRELEKQVSQFQKQSTATTTEVRLKNKYPDFDVVVNSDNLSILRKDYPEIANTINDSKDLYNKAVTAYTMLKKLGIHIEDTHETEKKLVQRNISKPRSLASISPQQGDSPLSHANAFANGLTPELKAKLYQEVLAAKKRH